MTYENIADWVFENFTVGNYSNFEDLWRDVQSRFVEDGMYLPPESREVIEQNWNEVQPEKPDSSLYDFIVPQPSQEGLDIPSSDFFIGMSDPQPPQPLPPILQITQPKPEPTITTRIIDPFKSVGSTFKSAFKRLFGR